MAEAEITGGMYVQAPMRISGRTENFGPPDPLDPTLTSGPPALWASGSARPRGRALRGHTPEHLVVGVCAESETGRAIMAWGLLLAILKSPL